MNDHPYQCPAERAYNAPRNMRLQRMEHAQADMSTDQRSLFRTSLMASLAALIGDDQYDLALRVARAQVLGGESL